VTQKATYTHEDIRVLGEVEHIRQAPAMYIGVRDTPNHLISELLDNAIDEAQAGYASLIGVEIDTKTHIVSIADNGRGIPYENNTIPTVATKLFSGGKFDKGDKNRAYKIACLVGSTKIQLIDGSSISIEEMAKNPTVDYWVITSSTDGKWLVEKAIRPSVSGFSNIFIRVKLDNGQIEECTPDHLWLMRDGSYKESADLKCNDSLMPCYIGEFEGHITIRPNDTYDYERNIQYERRGWVPLHRISYESFYGVKIPFNYSIHHKDFNKKNNIPSNLTCIDNKDHLPLHTDYFVKQGKINTEALVRYNKSDRGRENSRIVGLGVGSDSLRRYVYSEKNRTNKRELMSKFNKIDGKQKELQLCKIKKYIKTLIVNNVPVTKDNFEKYRIYGIPKFEKTLKKFNDLEDMISQSSSYQFHHNSLVVTNGQCMIRKRIISIAKKIKDLKLNVCKESYNLTRNTFDPSSDCVISYFGSFNNLEEEVKFYNHKVVSVEYVMYPDKIPVYDLHTPQNHNFVLSSGAVVHNSGIHGVGIVAVTALSDFMEITVYRTGKKAFYRFEDAKVVQEKLEDYTGTIPFSTQVTFKPTKKYFDSLTFNLDAIRDRLKLASVYVPTLQLILSVDKNKEIINCKLPEFFQKEILDYDRDVSCITPIVDLDAQVKDEHFRVRFCWNLNSSATPKIAGSVNMLRVDVGTHVNSFYDIIKDSFELEAEKSKLKFNKIDSLLGLRCFISTSLYEPEYSSQTKERLSVSKTKIDHLVTELKNKFVGYLNSNEVIKQQLLAFFSTYRKKQDAKGAIVKTDGQVSRLCSVIDSSLRDCTSHDVSKTELFIVEGISAGGTIISARDPKLHAILSLKGKILNIADDNKDFYKNKEIIELVNALGTGIEPDFHLEGVRYSRVVITTDADSDGCAFLEEQIYVYENGELNKYTLEHLVLNKEKFIGKMTIGFDIESKSFVLTPIERIFALKEFDSYYEVEFEDGSRSLLTEDHPILKENLEYIKTKESIEKDIISYEEGQEFR